jgi:hypothetical protein
MSTLSLPCMKMTKQKLLAPMNNQNGSMILVALILLLMMSIIAFSSSRTAVTESFILRNTAIHQQNISLVESAALELAEQVLIDIPDPANPHLAETSPVGTRQPYIISDDLWNSGSPSKNDAWYSFSFGTLGAGRVLTGTGTNVSDPFLGVNRIGSTTYPQWVEPFCATELTLIDDVRDETGSPLRATVVGWVSAPGSSLKLTKATRKRARVLAEYVSPNYGMSRLELGIEREF